MRRIKWIVIVALTLSVLGGTGLAQEEQRPAVRLGFSERCNNFLRHYCMAGSHEMAVNYVLLGMKEQGTPITVKLIKQVARKTPARYKTPQPATAQ